VQNLTRQAKSHDQRNLNFESVVYVKPQEDAH